MGLDYGSKTVGVAVSDALLLTAQNIETICREQENKLRRTLARIQELCLEYEVEEIVLGFPKNMNNTTGDRAEKSLEFAEMLKKRTGLPVVMWDERLTTVAANRTLMESGVRRENRKEHIDQIAAVFILQGYLDGEYSISANSSDFSALSPIVLFIFFGKPNTIRSTSYSRHSSSILASVLRSLFSCVLQMVSTA